MGETLVMGLGPVGRATLEALAARGDRVRAAQRSRPKALPAGVDFASCDVLDGEAVRRALDGVSQLVLAIGFPYDGRVWREAWPAAMRNVVAAASAKGTRVVFVDDLYMHGPQDAPLHRGHAAHDARRQARDPRGGDAHLAGRRGGAPTQVRGAALPGYLRPRRRPLAHRRQRLRAPRAGQGGDAGRAAGHPPRVRLCARHRPRGAVAARCAGRRLRAGLEHAERADPDAARDPRPRGRGARRRAEGAGDPARAAPRSSGFAVPFLREVREMRFLFDRPYRVDASKFTTRFWSDVTPFEVGAPATARSFAAPAG